MLKKNTAYKIFQLAWIYFLIINIADFGMKYDGDFIPAVHLSNIPFLKYLPYLFAGLLLIPVPKIIAVFKDSSLWKGKNNIIILGLVFLLLVYGFVNGMFSAFSGVSFAISLRFAFYFMILILTLAAINYFPGALDFIIKSFIYANCLVIAGSLLDFYVPAFHQLLISNFGRPLAESSFMNIGEQRFMRPMGFLSDSNLTAFSLGFSSLLLLVNQKKFRSKIFVYSFYVLSGYVFGMLASRGALIMCIFTIIALFFLKVIERKHIYLYAAIFILSQMITPQTQARIYQFFDPTQIEEEFEVGRPVIWQASIDVFKTKPLTGVGPAGFFEVSDIYIRKILEKRPDLNIDYPDKPHYHQIDKYNPHSIFLVILTEFGTIGLIIFLSLLVYILALFFKQKKIVSIIFFINLMIVSSLSNYAPYYKWYLTIIIVFYVASFQNMKISENKNNV